MTAPCFMKNISGKQQLAEQRQVHLLLMKEKGWHIALWWARSDHELVMWCGDWQISFFFLFCFIFSAQDWLSRYGYLPPPDPRTSKLQTKEGIEKAIRVMQRFGGVQETGVIGKRLLFWLEVMWGFEVAVMCFFVSTSDLWLTSLSDDATIRLMSTPRCSLPDITGSEDMLKRRRRKKRYALSGLKWHKTDLTWRCVHCHVILWLYDFSIWIILLSISSTNLDEGNSSYEVLGLKIPQQRKIQKGCTWIRYLWLESVITVHPLVLSFWHTERLACKINSRLGKL